jgi:hypothetical protein
VFGSTLADAIAEECALLFPDLFSPEEERFWQLSTADGTPYDVVDPVDRQCAVHRRERRA